MERVISRKAIIIDNTLIIMGYSENTYNGRDESLEVREVVSLKCKICLVKVVVS